MQLSTALVWTIIGVAALAIEAAHLGLIFLFVGVAALIAGVLSALGIPLPGQLIGFAVSAVVLAAVLRSDLCSFVRKSFLTILPGTAYLPNWHIDAIVHQLMRVQAGEISRLLINQPPRPCDRARPDLRRRQHRALAAAHRRYRGPCRARSAVRAVRQRPGGTYWRVMIDVQASDPCIHRRR